MGTLEFYGGVDEIGGNKIKLNLNNTSLLLDFGMSFKQYGKYFGDFINPRKANGIGDFFELGLIPKINGIYREDYLKHMGLPFEDEPAVKGLLLSHAHADHANYITHLRNDIPLYMSLNSKIILEVIDETGANSSFTDVCSYRKQFEYYLNKKGNYSQLKSPNNLSEREIKVLKPYENTVIGDLNVQLAPVDHSLPGASAFLIEGDDKRVVYTGDLRFHGRNRESTKRFVKEAKKFSPDILICEGTRINSEYYNSEHPHKRVLNVEEDIEKKAYDDINEFKGLVIVNFPLRDLDRLITFHNIAKFTNRTLLINMKQAYMLKRIEEENPEKTIYPSLNDDNLGIYIPRKGSGLFPNTSYVSYEGEWRYPSKEEYLKDYAKWEREFLEDDKYNIFTYNDIQENENQYIIRLDNFSFLELIDIKPENAVYLHSTTEPFNEEMEMDFEITQNWLNHFNIPILKHYHLSGHAGGPELINMVCEINPDVLYPIHTEHAELYDVLNHFGIEVIHPKNLINSF